MLFYRCHLWERCWIRSPTPPHWRRQQNLKCFHVTRLLIASNTIGFSHKIWAHQTCQSNCELRTCVEIVVDPVENDVPSQLKCLVEKVPKAFPAIKAIFLPYCNNVSILYLYFIFWHLSIFDLYPSHFIVSLYKATSFCTSVLVEKTNVNKKEHFLWMVFQLEERETWKRGFSWPAAPPSHSPPYPFLRRRRRHCKKARRCDSITPETITHSLNH